MNALYAIRHKGKIALLLLAVVSLELLCSHSYNNSISQIGNSFTEVYSDRLIAQDYIYKMAKILHKEQSSLENSNQDSSPSDAIFTDHGLKMTMLLTNYEKTSLTLNESVLFYEFKNAILVMLSLEKTYRESNDPYLKDRLHSLQYNSITTALNKLDKLSEIQVSRGRNLYETSQKTVSFSGLLNQFDWALVIVIGLIIQALIFASKSTQPKRAQNQFLN